MSWKFNPFTGDFDYYEASVTTSPGGSDTQVQFNDGGVFGGDAGLTYNKTTDVMTVGSALKAGVGLAYLGDGLGTATPTNYSTLNLQNNLDGSGEYGTIFAPYDDTDSIIYFNNLHASGSFDFYANNLGSYLARIDGQGFDSQNGYLDATLSPSAGGVMFVGPTGGRFSADSSNLFWNDTNNRLSIGCADAVDTLKVKGSGTGYVSIGQMTGYTSAGAITFNATSSTGGYHIASDNSGDLLINRPSAKIVYFRSNNSTQMYISAAGILTIGGNSYWDSTFVQKLNIASSNTGDDKWGSRFEHVNTGTGYRHAAIYAQTQVTATNGHTGSLVNSALRLEGSVNSASIINASVAGFVSSITCGDNSYGVGTRVTMNNGYVAYLQSPFLYGASAITNMYGFYVAAQKITGVTNGWAVYSEGASDSSYIAGNIGVGTATISAKAHVLSTTEQLRLGYDASNYYSTTVGSTGGVTFNAVGSGAGFTYSDFVTITGAGTTSSPGTSFLILNNTHSTANDEFGVGFTNTSNNGAARITSILASGGATADLAMYAGGSTLYKIALFDGANHKTFLRNDTAANSSGQSTLVLSSATAAATAGSGARIDFVDPSSETTFLAQIKASAVSAGKVGLVLRTYDSGLLNALVLSEAGAGTFASFVDAASYKVGGSAGASGSFTTTDLKTVTVTNGIITSIV